MINKIKWISFVISLFFIASCDSVSNIEILNTNIDSVFIYDGEPLSTLSLFKENDNISTCYINDKCCVYLKKKQSLIVSNLIINELQLNEIPIDTLIIFTKTDTLYKLYGQDEIFEVFKNKKRFFGGYCLEINQ